MNIIVTGATGAIGAAAVSRLRTLGHNVIGTSRREEHDGYRPLDISSPSSIEAFAQGLEADGIRLDGLLNNAGTLLRHYQTNSEGFELVTATNYLGTYRLTRRLMPLMNRGAHVVCTVSLSCHISHLDKSFFDLHSDNYSQIGNYADSKMAVMLFAQELHRRHGDQIVVHLTDPGVVDSRILHMNRWFDPLADLLFRPLCKRPEQGALPAVNALLYSSEPSSSSAPTEKAPLLLFRGNRHSHLPNRWQRPEMARWLWEETERQLNK